MLHCQSSKNCYTRAPLKNLLFGIALACVAAFAPSARAQNIINSNNTVVRFEVFTGGASFGSIDLELFDQEKPETVRHFLMYVYSGAYSNLVLHRLAPHFLVQAGHGRLDDPSSTEIFSNYPPTTAFGNITNEFGVGPRRTNDFGTIAMARLAGQANSASSDWFINLRNNSSLDTDDGGFTV